MLFVEYLYCDVKKQHVEMIMYELNKEHILKAICINYLPFHYQQLFFFVLCYQIMLTLKKKKSTLVESSDDSTTRQNSEKMRVLDVTQNKQIFGY